ncbi:MAG: cytochrome P450 [Chthoniobacterales bacterium]|nr:cytochrome P450 [Chthoniobacterales bacterium]
MSSAQNESLNSASPKKIIMIMGVQRSGTTTLFNALASAANVTAREESPDDQIYSDYFLRPEPEIRDVLQGLPGTIVLKPVRESERRSPLEVANEYADYDLRIIWLYRDPVNVFDSYLRCDWLTIRKRTDALTFAGKWHERNAQAVADAADLGDRLVVVSYEDLVTDPDVLRRLGLALELRVKNTFRDDSALGRMRQPGAICGMIDDATASVRSHLDRMRLVKPATPGKAPDSLASRFTRWIHRFRPASRHHNAPQENTENRDIAVDQSVPAVVTAVLRTSHYWEVLLGEDPSALYSRWLAAGPLRHHADINTFVALGYNASRAILERSAPFRPVPTLAQGVQPPACVVEIGRYMAECHNRVRDRLTATLAAWEAALPRGQQGNLLEQLAPLSIDWIAIWLDISTDLAAAVTSEIQGLYFSTDSANPSPAWESLAASICQKGVVADLCAAGLLRREDVLGFVCDAVTPAMTIPPAVCNSLGAIAAQPDVLALARQYPEKIPAIFMEAMRLVPMWFSLKRRLSEAIRIGDVSLPKGATAEVFIATANRDPAAFESPDQLIVDRQSPQPLLPITRSASLGDGENDLEKIGRKMFLELSSSVLGRLLAAPLQFPSPMPPRLRVSPLPGGDVFQKPQELIVALEGNPD